MIIPDRARRSGKSLNIKNPNIAATTISKYKIGAAVDAGISLRPYTTKMWEIWNFSMAAD